MLKLINVVDNLGEINRSDVADIICFQKLIKRVKKCKGDMDGRLKIMAQRELAYITAMADYDLEDNIYSGLSRKDKHTQVCKNIGMPKEWKPDKVVNECIAKYIEIIDTYIPSAALLNSLERGLMTSKKVIDNLLEQMEGLVEDNAAKLSDAISSGADDETIEKLNNSTILLSNCVTTILNIATKVPKTLESMKNLQGEVKKEKSEAKRLRGDKKKYNREDPT